jgi:hypothetical protein
VSEPLSISDPELREAIGHALVRADELLVFVRHIFGAREWWLVTTEAELEHALGRAGTVYGSSDAVEVYATGELPFRSNDKARLREHALAFLAEGDVVLACRREGDPELHDVDETDSIEDVDEWLAADHAGELLLGPHPLVMHDDNDFYPDNENAFLAYVPLPDGTVKPGSY